MKPFAVRRDTLTPVDIDNNAFFDALDAASLENWRARHGKRDWAACSPSALPFGADQNGQNGTWLHEDLCLLGKAGAELKEVVLLSLEDLERSRPGRRRRLGWRLANFEKRVECVVANALRAHFYRLSDRVSYSRGVDSYRLKPSWMSGDSMRRTVDLMEAAGLVSTSKGQWSGFAGTWEGTCSTYWLDEDLADFVQSYGVKAHNIGKRRPHGARVIRMRGAKDARGKAPELTVELTPEILKSAELLHRYNRFVETFDVSVDCTERQKQAACEWHEKNRDKDDRQPGIKELELFSRSVKRIFNDGTFERGGRLYGAFWTHVPKWVRQLIRIDGQETLELDFSGLSVRMLYHERGIAYDEDPYEIPALEAYAEEQGLPKAHYRSAVKTLLQAILNDEDDEGHPEAVKLNETFRPRFTRSEVRRLIEEKHSAIADAFGTGEGKRLQREDSDLAIEIIVNLMDQGILALPIHDSFIVQSIHREALRDEMRRTYRRRFRFDPVIN
jgi:hypothetical protein